MTRLLSIAFVWWRKHAIATNKSTSSRPTTLSPCRTSNTNNVPHLQFCNINDDKDKKSHTKSRNKLSVNELCNEKNITHIFPVCSQTSGPNKVMAKLSKFARTTKNKSKIKNKKKQNEGGETSKAPRKIWMLCSPVVWKDPRCPIHDCGYSDAVI